MGEYRMPGALTLMIYVLTGVGGMAYFMYGRRQQNAAFLFTGVCLCIYPYLFNGLVMLILIGLVLLAAPFLVNRQ